MSSSSSSCCPVGSHGIPPPYPAVHDDDDDDDSGSPTAEEASAPAARAASLAAVFDGGDTDATATLCGSWIELPLLSDTTSNANNDTSDNAIDNGGTVKSTAAAAAAAAAALAPNTIRCYYTRPPPKTTTCTSSNPSGVAGGLVVYTDVWGFHPQSRIRVVCDALAAHTGLQVISPDCLRGNTVAQHPFGDDFPAWIRSVPYNPIVYNDTITCLQYLQQQLRKDAKTTTTTPPSNETFKFGVIGYCWGAWAMAKSCCSAPSAPPAIPWHCAVAIHPSLKPESYAFGGKDPDDHLRLLHDLGTHCPCLILAASNDREYFKPAATTTSSLEKEEAGGGDAAILAPLLDNGGKVIVFPEMLHGWMTRGDIQQDAAIKRDVQLAFHETVEFIRRNMRQG